METSRSCRLNSDKGSGADTPSGVCCGKLQGMVLLWTHGRRVERHGGTMFLPEKKSDIMSSILRRSGGGDERARAERQKRGAESDCSKSGLALYLRSEQKTGGSASGAAR